MAKGQNMATSRTSAAMERALDLVRAGTSPYAAAQQAGVTASGIRRSPQYRAMLADGTIRKFPKGNRKPGA